MAAALAAIAAVAVVPGLAAGSAPSSASFTAYDFGWSANGNVKSTRLTVAQGATVTFSYPTGINSHNADFGKGPKPSDCTQTAGPASGSVPPLPRQPTKPGWSGTCTFDAPGIYNFHCDLHTFMTGTVVVQGPGGSPFAGKPTIHSPQRGAVVKGSVTLSNAATGGSLQVDVRASAKSLGRRGSGQVRVARLMKSAVKPGTLRFAVGLNTAAKRAERRVGRLTVTVEVTAQAPGGHPVSTTRRVLLRP